MAGKGYGAFQTATRRWLAHRASWVLHFGEIPGGLWVLHRCDNPACVRPSHLFLGTNRDNVQDAIAKKRMLVGERNGHSKLTGADVVQIRERLAAGERPTDLAPIFNVSRSLVSLIGSRLVWKHL